MARAALQRLAVVLGALALWQLAVVVFKMPAYLLPLPFVVAQKFALLAGSAELSRHIAATLTEVLAGSAIGAAAGLLCGWLFARIPLLGRLLSPLILLLQTAPKIAIAPLLLLWLGLGLGPKVVLIAIVAFFPVMAGTVAGLSGVDKSYRDLARLLKLSAWTRFRRIELPFAAPPVFAGLKIASTQAMTASVVGELMGATYGLGYLLSLGQENNDAGVVIAAILMLCVMGWALHEAVRLTERRLLGWHESQIIQEAAG
ncbi:ABC transporter permease [Terrarubrum flagellatum]|uniref:ABC transporter permease n=1 Tax=Terrirubrum flagellatum TaxID=2895980 RepID=UPI003144DC36